MKPLVNRTLYVIAAISTLLLFTSAYGSVRPAVLEYDQGMVSFSSADTSVRELLSHLSDMANVQIYITDALTDTSKRFEFDRIPLEMVLESLLHGYSYAVIYKDNATRSGRVVLSTSRAAGMAAVTNGQPVRKAEPDSGLESGPDSSKTLTDAAGRDSGSMEMNQSENATGLGYTQSAAYNNSNGTPRRYSDSHRPKTASRPEQNSSSGSSVNSGGSYSYSDNESGQSNETGTANAPSEQNPNSVSQTDIPQEMDETALKIMKAEYKIKELETYIESGKAEEFYTFWTETQGRDPKYVYNPWNELERYKQTLEELQN